jgi:hypothetical protein
LKSSPVIGILSLSFVENTISTEYFGLELVAIIIVPPDDKLLYW